MRYVAAYLLAKMGGNENPTKQDVCDILASVGIDADQQRLDAVMDALAGKDIEQVMAAGREKLCNMGTTAAQTPMDTTAGDAPADKQKTKSTDAANSASNTDTDDDGEENLGFGLFDEPIM